VLASADKPKTRFPSPKYWGRTLFKPESSPGKPLRSSQGVTVVAPKPPSHAFPWQSWDSSGGSRVFELGTVDGDVLLGQTLSMERLWHSIALTVSGSEPRVQTVDTGTKASTKTISTGVIKGNAHC
jgi:hypothetical protein